MADTDPPQALTGVSCPHCVRPVSVRAEDAGVVVVCPHCGGEFTLPPLAMPAQSAEPADSFVVDDEGSERAGRNEDDLDGLRIRQVSHLRRSANRGRSYAIIGMLACYVVSVQVVWTAANQFRSAQVWWPVAKLVIALGLLACGNFLRRRAARLGEELRRPLLAEPQSPPDFGPLGDGSQRLRELERSLNGQQPPSNGKEH